MNTFSGLNPIITAHACDLISQIASMDEKNTIIVVSHDIPSIVSIADILWIMGFDYEEKEVETTIPKVRTASARCTNKIY